MQANTGAAALSCDAAAVQPNAVLPHRLAALIPCAARRIQFGGGGIFGACKNIDISEINGYVTVRGQREGWQRGTGAGQAGQLCRSCGLLPALPMLQRVVQTFLVAEAASLCRPSYLIIPAACAVLPHCRCEAMWARWRPTAGCCGLHASLCSWRRRARTGGRGWLEFGIDAGSQAAWAVARCLTCL